MSKSDDDSQSSTRPTILSGLYETREEEREVFGDAWCGPESFEYSETALVATYEGQGDGLDVEVYCTALPSRFYRIRALDGENSIGEPKEGFTMSTGSGSGMRNLAAQIAKAVAEGMLGIRR